MRIISGSAGGRLLKAPKGFDVRPTPDLVRQALFNSLGSRVEGARVLEMFGGTGALSLESLSRGATTAACIEKSSRHADILRKNAEQAGLSHGLELRVQDAFIAIHQLADAGRKFDLILADPPYGDKNVGKRSVSFAQKVLDDPKLPELLAPNGIFVLGHTKRDTLELTPPWIERKFMKHGDTVMRFLEIKSDAPSEAL